MDGLHIPQRDGPIDVHSDSDEELDACIYVRTSSPSQTSGYSISEQINRCWDQCEAAGWSVKYVFSDKAESGRDMDRTQFQKMLERAEEGRINVVVFWKLDRFCRSLADLVKIEEKLRSWDVALHSVTEFIDTTSPVGRFNFRNLASAAELESDLTSQRVQIGMYGLARENKWPNDHPPLGYDKTSTGRLEVVDDEANLVRWIFHIYLEERSMPQVAHLLNEKGITTKNGDQWCRQSVNTVLSNELYIGNYELADYCDQVEEYRILRDELFEEVVETRFRFQNSGNEMDPKRKKSKSERVLNHFKWMVQEGG
ncbi:recombinase family protein [Halobacteria archaeon AArc-curdl1]|uniref:Recombinase family protein n=1 Tax=Natronosalvus hydrolyticus TaxID=2979988 RepID=A0AAP3E752_9EURY|nr:recombinase family protein [Halobacteria archaeon AArc-curdl1]